MNPNLNFDAEGVFEQPFRPKRKRRKWRERWIALTNGAKTDERTIKKLMRAPKLLRNAMPRVMPDVEKLKEQGVTVGECSSWSKMRPSYRMRLQALWNDAYAEARLKGLGIDESEIIANLRLREVCEGREFGRKYATRNVPKKNRPAGLMLGIQIRGPLTTNSDTSPKPRDR